MKKSLILILCLVLLLSLVPVSGAESIDTKKNEAESLKEELDQIKEQKKEVEKQEDEVKSDLYSVIAKKENLEAQISKTESDIEKTKKEIVIIEKDLKVATARIDKQKEDFGQRVAAMYTTQNDGFFEIILKSTSISDFLNRLDYQRTINEQDQMALEALRKEHQKFKSLEQKAKEKHKSLELLSEQQKADKEELVAVEKELEARAAELEAEKESIQASIDQKENDLVQLESLISSLEQEAIERARAHEEEQRRQQGSDSGDSNTSVDPGNVTVSNSGWVWPVPTSHYISSPFGYREEPIAGLGTFHKGMDIADDVGNNILAVQGGVVIYSGWMEGYGNTVMIQHSNGISTLYGHCSAIYVAEGQYVEQGSVIAAIGNTGWSTGPHLHIGFFVDGGWVDPALYLY